MFVTGWWPGACLVQRFLLGAICNQRDHAGLVCAYQKQPKMCMKWDREIAQRMLIISVHLAHIFNCWTLVAPKVSLSPCCDYGWLALTLYRATATHAAATRYPVTSWPTIPRDTGLQRSCAIRAHRQALEQQLRTQPVGHLNPGSGQSYCSCNSHTNSNSALMKYTLRASGWPHSTKLYRDIKICIHRTLEQLVGTMNYFVCISVSEIYLETWCMSVLRRY